RCRHLVKRSELAIVVEPHLLDDLLADREGASRRRRRRHHALKALARRQCRGEQRMLFIDTLAGMTGDAFRQMADRMLSETRNLVTLHRGLAEALHPDLARPIGADLDDLIVFEPGPDRIEGAVNEDGQTSRQRVHASAPSRLP